MKFQKRGFVKGTFGFVKCVSEFVMPLEEYEKIVKKTNIEKDKNVRIGK